MDDKAKKFILTSFWIIFIIITISIYTFQALIHSQADFTSFMNFLMVIILICVLIVLFSYLGSKNKIPYLTTSSPNENTKGKRNDLAHYCPYCGTMLDKDSEYCSNCGKLV